MGFVRYPALFYQEPGEENWSILFPDFPEIASAAERIDDIDRQALDALATAIDVYADAGKPLPEPSSSFDARSKMPAGAKGDVCFYPAVAPEPMRVNISIDRTLLARIDEMAERKGMTRSGFLAAAARAVLEHETGASGAKPNASFVFPG